MGRTVSGNESDQQIDSAKVRGREREMVELKLKRKFRVDRYWRSPLVQNCEVDSLLRSSYEILVRSEREVS